MYEAACREVCDRGLWIGLFTKNSMSESMALLYDAGRIVDTLRRVSVIGVHHLKRNLKRSVPCRPIVRWGYRAS
jgi:hypothetical protein